MKKNVHVNYVAVLDEDGTISVEFTSSFEEAAAWQQFKADSDFTTTAYGNKELVFNEDDILTNGFDVEDALEDAADDTFTMKSAERALQLLRG